jgi:hypothetical protein
MQATNHTTSIERQTLDWQEIAEGQRRARVLRSQAFTQLCVAVPARWLRSRIDAARRAAGAPLATA